MTKEKLMKLLQETPGQTEVWMEQYGIRESFTEEIESADIQGMVITLRSDREGRIKLFEDR